jgi:hypothetical protein
MISSQIFATGVVCFAITLIGALLTIYEFSQLSRANAKLSAPPTPLPAGVHALQPRRRA